MKTLSIILMVTATGFGIFNFITAKKSGVYDQLYKEAAFHPSTPIENKEINTVSALPEVQAAEKNVPEEIVQKEVPIPFRKKADSDENKKSKKKTDKKDDSKAEADDLTPAEKAQLDSAFTIDEIESYFAVDVDTLKNAKDFDFNIESFSREIPTKEEQHHYSLVSNFIKQKVLNWQANNKSADTTKAVVSTQAQPK